VEQQRFRAAYSAQNNPASAAEVSSENTLSSRPKSERSDGAVERPAVPLDVFPTLTTGLPHDHGCPISRIFCEKWDLPERRRPEEELRLIAAIPNSYQVGIKVQLQLGQ